MEQVEELSWCINASVILMYGLSLIDGLEFTDWPVSDVASTPSDLKVSRRCAVLKAASSSCDGYEDCPGDSARLLGELCRVQTSWCGLSLLVCCKYGNGIVRCRI